MERRRSLPRRALGTLFEMTMALAFLGGLVAVYYGSPKVGPFRPVWFFGGVTAVGLTVGWAVLYDWLSKQERIPK